MAEIVVVAGSLAVAGIVVVAEAGVSKQSLMHGQEGCGPG